MIERGVYFEPETPRLCHTHPSESSSEELSLSSELSPFMRALLPINVFCLSANYTFSLSMFDTRRSAEMLLIVAAVLMAGLGAIALLGAAGLAATGVGLITGGFTTGVGSAFMLMVAVLALSSPSSSAIIVRPRSGSVPEGLLSSTRE